MKCSLYDKPCNHCGECDMCDLTEGKMCDNCGKCLGLDREYNSIKIDRIIMPNSENKKNGK